MKRSPRLPRRPRIASGATRWWPAAVAGVLASCGAPAQRAGTDAAGVAVTAADVVALSHTESLSEVRDLAVLPSGEVWALNSIEPLFIGFTPDGGILREHGRLGGGPDEFGAPTAFVTGNVEDAAWVFDAERHALIEVSEARDDRREIRLPSDESLPPTHLFGGRELIGAGLRSARLGNELVFARNAPAMEGGMLSFWRAIWSADLVAYDPDSGSVRHLISLAQTLGDPDDAFQLVGDFPPFPFWFRLWTVCSDAEIRVYDRLSNQVRAFSAEGAPLRADTLPTVRGGRVTKEQMARVGFGLGMLEAGGELSDRATPQDSARIVARLSGRIEGDADRLEALLPRYVDMHCASDGTVWLRRYDRQRADLRGGLDWVRVAPDGALQEVAFPEGFGAHRFLADRVWGVMLDALDVPTVAWARLPPL